MPAPAKSISIGSLIGSFFGTFWLLWGVSFLGGGAWVLVAAVAILSCTILAWCIACFRYIRRRLPLSTDANQPSPFGWAYRIVVMLEGLFIGAGNWFVSAHHRADLLPVVTAIVVGLHFFPLARILKATNLYVVAIVVTVIPLVSLAIRNHALRDFASCSAIGVFMLAGSASALQRLAKKVAEPDQAPGHL